MTRLITFLNAPFPLNPNHRHVWVRSLVISLFVVGFLLVFRPFGIDTIESNEKALLIASFGLPCLFTIGIFGSVFVRICQKYNLEQRWKVKYEILLTMSFPILIGAANSVHGMFLYHWSLSWGTFLQMELNTIAVAFFPVVALVALDWIALLKKHEKIAAQVMGSSSIASSEPSGAQVEAPSTASTAQTMLTLRGENQNESVTFSLQDLLYIKAEANYVNVVTQSEAQSQQSELLRGTLSSLEKQLQSAEAFDFIKRCHRSYLVNQQRIQRASGNAQGLLLQLDASFDDTVVVPVSRKYVNCFR